MTHPHHERPWEYHEKADDPNYGRTCICGAAIRAGGRLVHDCKGPPGYAPCGPDGKVRAPDLTPADVLELKLLAAEACYLLERRTSSGSINSISSSWLKKWWAMNKKQLIEPAKARVHGDG